MNDGMNLWSKGEERGWVSRAGARTGGSPAPGGVGEGGDGVGGVAAVHESGWRCSGARSAVKVFI